jgi:CarD family transcriptional regulator
VKAALDWLSREIAVVQLSTKAIKEIESQLAKSPRRGAAKAEGGRRCRRSRRRQR